MRQRKIFSSFSRAWDKEKILSPTSSSTSDHRITRDVALWSLKSISQLINRMRKFANKLTMFLTFLNISHHSSILSPVSPRLQATTPKKKTTKQS